MVFYNHKDETESEHNYTAEITKEATCTQTGIKTYTCACGDSYTEIIEALGHLYQKSVTKQPTTAEEGIMTYICERCGDSYTSPIEKLPGGNGAGNTPGNQPGGNPSDGNHPGNGTPEGNPSDGNEQGSGTPEGDPSGSNTPKNPEGEDQTDKEEPEPGQEEDKEPQEDEEGKTGDSNKEPDAEPIIWGQDKAEGNVIQSGWTNICKEISSAEEGSSLVVDMNGTRVVPGNVLKELKGRNVTVVFEVGGGLAWSVNGKSLTAEKLADIDFSINILLLRGRQKNGPYLAGQIGRGWYRFKLPHPIQLYYCGSAQADAWKWMSRWCGRK